MVETKERFEVLRKLALASPIQKFLRKYNLQNPQFKTSNWKFKSQSNGINLVGRERKKATIYENRAKK